MPSSKIQTGLRLDETTYNKLKQLALQESRTLNNLVEHIIRIFLADYERRNGPIQEYHEE